VNVNGLILSLFPGLDLLGRAFEALGWCVVRGPDVLWAGDVRGWHAPAGRFDGIVGGPPCQSFSRLAALNRSQGREPRFGNLIPEFERIVLEATPAWWITEEVVGAPIPSVPGYREESVILSPRDLGDAQSRDRRITVGSKLLLGPVGLTGRLPALAGSQEPPTPAATGRGTKWENRPGQRGRPWGTQSWAMASQIAETQGYPGLHERLRATGLWPAAGVCQALGTGVARVVADALARAITEWWGEIA